MNANEIEMIGRAHVKWSTRADGPIGRWRTISDAALPVQYLSFHNREWLYLKQVHGNDVVAVDDPATHAGVEADAAVTNVVDVTLGIATADCAPIALASAEGIVGAVHAGWKGLRNGVVAAAADKMREMGATEIHAALGPCIHAECYEFLGDELDEIAADLGPEVIGQSAQGTRALDMIAAVRASCDSADVKLEFVHEDCTAHSGKYFSFRKNNDAGRQVMLVWKDEA